MKIIGTVLVLAGLACLAYGNIHPPEERVAVDTGPMSGTRPEETRLPLPSVAGVVFVMVGAILVANRPRGKD
jgi:hypothetical protein